MENEELAREALLAGLRARLSAARANHPDSQGEDAGADDAGLSELLQAEKKEVAAARQEIERLRSDLLSTVSHELRTPLTLIRTSVGLLLDTDPDPVMRDRLLRNIKQSADRMHALVTDILDLVRLRSGRAS